MPESNEVEEQEKVMKELFKKEMIRRIETKVKEGDQYVMNKLKKLIKSEEEDSLE